MRKGKPDHQRQKQLELEESIEIISSESDEITMEEQQKTDYDVNRKEIRNKQRNYHEQTRRSNRHPTQEGTTKLANKQLYEVVKVINHSNGEHRRIGEGKHENSMNIKKVNIGKTQSAKDNQSESSQSTNSSSSEDQTSRRRKNQRQSNWHKRSKRTKQRPDDSEPSSEDSDTSDIDKTPEGRKAEKNKKTHNKNRPTKEMRMRQTQKPRGKEQKGDKRARNGYPSSSPDSSDSEEDRKKNKKTQKRGRGKEKRNGSSDSSEGGSPPNSPGNSPNRKERKKKHLPFPKMCVKLRRDSGMIWTRALNSIFKSINCDDDVCQFNHAIATIETEPLKLLAHHLRGNPSWKRLQAGVIQAMPDLTFDERLDKIFSTVTMTESPLSMLAEFQKILDTQLDDMPKTEQRWVLKCYQQKLPKDIRWIVDTLPTDVSLKKLAQLAERANNRRNAEKARNENNKMMIGYYS